MALAPKLASSRRPVLLVSAAPALGFMDAGLPVAMPAAEELAPAPAAAAGAWALTEAACRQQKQCRCMLLLSMPQQQHCKG